MLPSAVVSRMAGWAWRARCGVCVVEASSSLQGVLLFILKGFLPRLQCHFFFCLVCCPFPYPDYFYGLQTHTTHMLICAGWGRRSSLQNLFYKQVLSCVAAAS